MILNLPWKLLMGFFTDSWVSTVPSPAQKYGLMFYISSIPEATTVEFIVSRIGPILPLLYLVDYFEPIFDTIKLTVVATGIDKIIID